MTSSSVSTTACSTRRPAYGPFDLQPGQRWTSEGTFGGSLGYRLTGRVVEAGPFSGEAGRFDDCRKVETRLVLSGGETTSDEWYCAGVGLVDSRFFDPSGALAQHLVRAEGGDPTISGGPAVSQAPARPSPQVDPEGFTRVGQAGDGESTIPPVWIPTDPPMVLSASYGGDLVAFDASGTEGAVLWRFRPRGTVYGVPAFDPARGRIYFGSSDKHVYALDARGLFLWSLRTGDNVASRPLVVEDLVIVGSEDGAVYGIDVMTGRPRWTVDAGGPVVSSPALAGDVAVVGSDSGGVSGLDPRTGRPRWRYDAQAPVEAPVVVSHDTAYVASRVSLAALDPITGGTHWVARVPSPLRTAPIVSPEAVFAVSEDGRLRALDRQRGTGLWTSRESGYLGPPVLVGETVLVAARDGAVHRFGLDGSEQGQWPAGEGVTFDIGLTSGGGALWLADHNGVVRRLGPVASTWVRGTSSAPSRTPGGQP